MLTSALSLAAGGLYFAAGALLIRHLWGARLASLKPVFALAGLAMLAHALLLHDAVIAQAAVLNIGFTNALSLSTWIVACVFIAAALLSPTYELGAVILPAAGLAVLAAWLWPPQTPDTVKSTGLTIHVLISLVAYAFLALAVVQSVIMALQDRRLRQHTEASVLHKLPPLETMERLLFQFIGIGFVLLTLGLVSGFWFSFETLGAAFVFNHHTILSLAAWLIFGTLLLGHLRYGWRGRIVQRWTIGGFVVLALAYFGWKFVLEILLQRS